MRSFEAVSDRFNSALVPLTADGMIVACTALRLAALSRGWRLPGSLVITYAFITGTVWLNVASAHGWADAVAHALAPLAYAALVEMLAHMLRLHLGLVEPPERRRSGVAGLARLGWLTWITSPVVTTRVGLTWPAPAATTRWPRGRWSSSSSACSGHSASYLTDAVAAGRENYYTGAVAAGEPPGRWSVGVRSASAWPARWTRRT